MIRALFLHRDLPFHGGVPKCILYFARGHDRSRVRVDVGCFMPPSPDMVSAFQALGVQAVHLGDDGYLAPARLLRRHIIDRNIDVIVCSSLKCYLVAKLANVGLGRVVVMWVHSINAILGGPARQALYNGLLLDDPIVYVSHAVRRAHQPKLHCGPWKVIYNGVNDPLHQPAEAPLPASARKQFGIPAGAFVMAYMAEFTPWKDHATLIEAFRLSEPARQNAHLILIGAGETFDATRSLALHSGVADRIHFLGPRPDGRRIVGMADAYIHASRAEGFGLAVVEAMLAARPVVVADEGACVEYVRHEKTGLTFRPGDASDLADRMTRLATDPALRARLGEAARRYCLDQFPMPRFIGDVCELLESVAQSRAG